MDEWQAIIHVKDSITVDSAARILIDLGFIADDVIDIDEARIHRIKPDPNILMPTSLWESITIFAHVRMDRDTLMQNVLESKDRIQFFPREKIVQKYDNVRIYEQGIFMEEFSIVKKSEYLTVLLEFMRHHALCNNR